MMLAVELIILFIGLCIGFGWGFSVGLHRDPVD